MISLLSHCRRSLSLSRLCQSPPQIQVSRMVRLLAQQEAVNVDLELFDAYKYSVVQLMELAGLACAHAVAKEYPVQDDPVLIVAGPGNNGGDGLVMARHLHLLGFTAHVHYPKQTDNQLYKDLVVQAQLSDVKFIDELPADISSHYSLVVDCIFGFSFKPPVRPQFSPILEAISKITIPLISVDIPSGWSVEAGPPDDGTTPVLKPDMLVSLTAPKKCSTHFTGPHHYLGGRFVPPKLAEKYQLDLPKYPGTDLVVKLT